MSPRAVASRRDWVGVIEAVYAAEASDRRWLSGIVDTVAPLADRGLGVTAELFDLSRTTPVPGGFRLCVPARVATPRGSTSEQLQRRLARFVPGPMLAVYGVPYAASTVMANMDRVPAAIGAAWRRVASACGVRDVLGVSACGPDRCGVLVAAARRGVSAPGPDAREQWQRIAVHLGAGLRLRGVAPVDPSSRGVEAVLRPDGRCDHAIGLARLATPRAALRAAAQDLDRARGPLRRRDPDEAVALWRGLVDGRWSLVDFFDTDGRRFVLARRNPPEWPRPRGLTPRERQVVVSAAAGASNKLIAYELGIAISTAATLLGSALRKLGVRRRSDLIPLVRALLGAHG